MKLIAILLAVLIVFSFWSGHTVARMQSPDAETAQAKAIIYKARWYHQQRINSYNSTVDIDWEKLWISNYDFVLEVLNAR